MLNNHPEIIQGGLHKDDRGEIAFVNGFDMSQIKRFYIITHPDTSVIRAWQGHQKEQRWFSAIVGSFKVVLVQPDNWDNPSDNLLPQEFKLSANETSILHIPAGYIFGFRALEANSKLLIFADASVEESSNDTFKYDVGLWHDWSK